MEGVLYLPGNPPIKLDSEDMLYIGDNNFYSLLPVRNIVETHANLCAVALASHVSTSGPIVTAVVAKKRMGRPTGAGDEDGNNQRKSRKQGNGVEGVST